MKRIRGGGVTDDIRGDIGKGADGAVGRRPRVRGHVKLGTRMWARIRGEFAAGASAPWLSARYGAGERTIGFRAKREGWRRKDLAEAADAGLQAAEARGDADPVEGPAIAAGLGLDGAARKAAEAFEAALAAVDEEARGGAAREAMNRAVACMRRDDAPAAMVWVKLAGALEGMGRGGGGSADDGADEAAQDAAMAVLCERLGLASSPTGTPEPPSPCTPANAGAQIRDAD